MAVRFGGHTPRPDHTVVGEPDQYHMYLEPPHRRYPIEDSIPCDDVFKVGCRKWNLTSGTLRRASFCPSLLYPYRDGIKSSFRSLACILISGHLCLECGTPGNLTDALGSANGNTSISPKLPHQPQHGAPFGRAPSHPFSDDVSRCDSLGAA